MLIWFNVSSKYTSNGHSVDTRCAWLNDPHSGLNFIISELAQPTHIQIRMLLILLMTIHIETVVLCGFGTLNYLRPLLDHFCLHISVWCLIEVKRKKWIACSIYPIFTVQLCDKRKQKKCTCKHVQLHWVWCRHGLLLATASIQSCYWLDWMLLNANMAYIINHGWI